MKNKLLLLALSLSLAACAAEDADLASGAAYDDDAVEVDSKEQALCAGPPAGYIKAAADNQGSWNGSSSPSDFTYHSYDGARAEHRYYAPVVALTRNVAGPCTSISQSGWLCASTTYTCPVSTTVAVSSSTGWSDTGIGTSWTPGYKPNGCGKSWKLPSASPVVGFQGKSANAQPGSWFLVCRYTPNYTRLKAL